MSGPPPPGQQPSPQQLAALQQQMIAAEAKRRGMTPQQLQAQQRQQLQADADKAGLSFDQYVNKLKQQAFENHQRQQQMAQQQAQNAATQPQGQPQMQGQQGQQVPITPGAPDPRALALAKWLRGQDLKPRTCILNGQRKDMFRGTASVFPFSSHACIRITKRSSSETGPTGYRLSGLHQSPQQKQPPARDHHRNAKSRNIQTAATLPAGSTCFEIRPPRRPRPCAFKAPKASQGTMDREDRTAAGHQRRSTLRLALRGPTVADETVCAGGSDSDHDGSHVPLVAGEIEDWRLVSQHGFSRTHRSLLRHGYFPPHPVLCDGLYGTAGTVAISESVRGCRFL